MILQPSQSIGIIAGFGDLPKLLLSEAKQRGFRTVVAALVGEADPILGTVADSMAWLRVGELGKLKRFFEKEGVRQTVMGGKVRKVNLFRGDVKPDLEMIKVLMTLKDHSDDSLLGGIANFLEQNDMPLTVTTEWLSTETLPRAGVLTKKKPSSQDRADIDFGWQLAKAMGRLDVGQTVVVKNKAVLAVEAVEGTDEAILRGGLLGHGDVVVVKVAKPEQDYRFDVPAVGLGTLDAMKQAKARVLAVEADKTIFLNRKEFIKTADHHRIAVIAKE